MNPPIRQDVPLAPLTTLGVGGPARYFAEAHAAADFATLAEWARQRGLPAIVLGGGSNVVIADAGLDALAIAVRLRGIAWGTEGEVTVAAGEPWDDFVAAAVERGWGGVERLSGIPGSAGATPIQNVGAYGQEVAETIVAVETTAGLLANAQCGFGYRSSAFQRERSCEIITAVRFRLRPGNADLAAARAEVIALRRTKSMVLDCNDPESRSVGSFFKNPVVTPEQAEALGSDAPRFAAPNGVKLAAAWLIERAGFAKGFRLDPASPVGLSRNHTLAIVNHGGGTAAQVIELATAIRTGVKDRFGVGLEIEPRLLGLRL